MPRCARGRCRRASRPPGAELLLAAQVPRPAEGGDLQGLAGGERGGPVPGPLEQQGLPHLAGERGQLGGGAAVHPQADVRAPVEHLGDAGDPGAEAAVGAGAVRRTRTGLGEDVDVTVAQMDGVGEPHVRAEPAELLHVVDRALPDLPQAVLLLVEGLGEVGVQAHPLGPGQRGGLGHQVGADRERRAGGDRDAEHRGEGRVVVGVDGLGRRVEDLVEPLDHDVRRQAALRPPRSIEPRAG